MQALILAAGKGTRLKEMTDNMTKCMVEINDESIIARLIRQIDNRGLSKIVIVVGYLSKKLEKYIDGLKFKTPVVFVENNDFENTNNIYSLALAREHLCEEDTILFESDLILEDSILDKVFENRKENFALLDKYDDSWMDGTCVLLGENNLIEHFIPKNNLEEKYLDNYYKTVNIYRFSKDFCKNTYMPELFEYMNNVGKNDYYERVLQDIVEQKKETIYGLLVEDGKWYEVDTQEDLANAKMKFEQ